MTDRLVADNQTLQRDLRLVRAQVQAAENISTPEKAIRARLQQVARLRDLFAERPALVIPELQLLSSFDWLRLAKSADLETEEGIRKALAEARQTAAYIFVSRLGNGVREFKKAHDEWPDNLAEFLRYVEPPLDPAMLNRYRMAVTGRIGKKQANYGLYVVLEKAPVDAEYDRIVRGINDTGGAGTSFSWVQAPLYFAIQDARIAYLKNHDWTTPRGDTRYYESYLQPAPMREIVEAQFKYQQDVRTLLRPGAASVRESSDIIPYLTTPEARALAEQLWPNKE